jgi:hypothetical protein
MAILGNVLVDSLLIATEAKKRILIHRGPLNGMLPVGEAQQEVDS